MSCTTADFLKVANRLSAGVEEIDWRCAISRAYYCAYHESLTCVHVCPEIGYVRGGMHQQTIERFCQSSDGTAKKLGYVLRDLRNRREAADYKLDDMFVASDAAHDIGMAEKALMLVHQLLAEYAKKK